MNSQHPDSVPSSFQVKAEQERDYGIIKKRYAVTANFVNSTEQSILHAQRYVDLLLEQMFDEYETETLPKLREVEYQDKIQNTADEGFQTAIKLWKTSKGGKTFYYVSTPRWSKYGAAMYPEAKGFDTALHLLGGDGELDLDQCSVKVALINGKPKVIEFHCADVPF